MSDESPSAVLFCFCFFRVFWSLLTFLFFLSLFCFEQGHRVPCTDTGDTGVRNVEAPSSTLDQSSAGRFSPIVNRTNPIQETRENDHDDEDLSEENHLIEVQLFCFSKGEVAYSSSSFPLESAHFILATFGSLRFSTFYYSEWL